MKKFNPIEVDAETVYGRGAMDESLKDLNRINNWSFIEKN